MSEIYDYPELLEGNEELVPLTEACELFRPPISRATIERYFRVGVRGVVLRTVLMGGSRCTTASEVKRFELEQLPNPISCDGATKNAPKRSARKTGGGMTAEEVSAGLARHGLES